MAAPQFKWKMQSQTVDFLLLKNQEVFQLNFQPHNGGRPRVKLFLESVPLIAGSFCCNEVCKDEILHQFCLTSMSQGIGMRAISAPAHQRIA